MNQTDKNIQEQKPKTSKLAIFSLFLCILGIVVCLMSEGIGDLIQTYSPQIPEEFIIIFFGPGLLSSSIIVGVIALLKISKYEKVIKGRNFAVISIISSIVMFSLFVFLVMGGFWVRDGRGHLDLYCGTRISGLGRLIWIYAGDFEEKYPIADKWCDLLLENTDTIEEQFICPAAAKGRGHYAMNPNCQPNSPPDTVLLFETKPGWNQFGGPELLSFENHESKRCNILFNAGYVRSIKHKDVNELNWGTKSSIINNP